MLILGLLAGASAGENAGGQYISNRAPLGQTAYVHLPLGAVQPRGWLHDQLQVQANGLTSYLWSSYFFTPDDANPCYHQEGVVALAFELNDPRLLALARGYVERRITDQTTSASLTFGNASMMRFLMEYQEATGDKRIIPWMRAWYQKVGPHIPPAAEVWWEKLGSQEHLGPLYWLYNRTGDASLLGVARALADSPLFSISMIADGFLRFPEARLNEHGVTTAWRIKYPGLLYQQDPQERYRKAPTEGISRLDRHYGQVAGRFAADEVLPPIAEGRNPSRGTELCNTIEYAYSMERLFEIFGDPANCDRLEALAYNTWPGEMTPDMWAHQYDTLANQVVANTAERGWTDGPSAILYGQEPNWTCCLSNMHQGWPRFVENMWLATHDSGLVAAAYGPCEVTAKVGAAGRPVTIREETEYPFDGKIRFTIKAEGPVKFPLRLRIPAWAAGAKIKAGGDTIPAQPGQVAVLDRTWKPGETIKLDLPMEIRIEERFNKAAAVRRGPLYFALRIGQDYRENPWESQIGNLAAQPVREKSGFPLFDWEIYPSTPWNYALAIDRERPAKSFKLKRHPLGRIPFAQKGEPLFVTIPKDDAARLEKAKFKAEVSQILPHPAEVNLKTDGKPWTLGPGKDKQWVGFERIVWSHDEPLVLKVKGRRLPQWKMCEKPNPMQNKQMVGAMADPPPLSPVESAEPLVDLELIPYGCTRLRVTEFPVLRPATPQAGKDRWFGF